MQNDFDFLPIVLDPGCICVSNIVREPTHSEEELLVTEKRFIGPQCQDSCQPLHADCGFEDVFLFLPVHPRRRYPRVAVFTGRKPHPYALRAVRIEG